MKEIIPYLFFNGNCRQAMEFYQHCFSGELQMFKYGDAPSGSMPESAPKDAIMHSKLISKHITILASDTPNQSTQKGDHVYLCIDCESIEEIAQLFKALSEKGKVIHDLKDVFWGARFGMLVDQFGIPWMFNFDYHPKESQH